MNCAGTYELETPNLDRLAETGTRFESFFCASPVCSPARASILTGHMPSTHGVQDFLRAGNSTKLKGDGKTVRYMDGHETYVKKLAEAGYDTGLSGKWHLGDSASPQSGFQFWDVFATGSGNYYNSPMFRNGKPYSGNGYISDVITDNALGFLESQADSDSPFSLNVHYTAPHAPWEREQHPTELYDRYFDNCPFESVQWDPIHPEQLAKLESENQVGSTEEKRRIILSGYFAAITAMDANVGRLLDWLEANNLRENTLVIFTSDNGMSLGHHGIWGKGNGTYPANMFDTAVKVPTLISMPGTVTQGEVSGELLSHYDLMPTVLDFAGVEDPASGDRPGKSFAAHLRGDSSDFDRPVVVYDEYGPTRMIRTKTAKYIHRYPDGPYEFYDLANDPGETSNEITNPAFSETINSLRGELQNWFANYSTEEMDGSRQPIKGRGQTDRIGGKSEAFAQDVVYLRDL